MNRKLLLAAVLILPLVGIGFAQTSSPDSIFVPVRQIGRLRPSGIQYDPNFDRFAMVDLQGRLVLADAATYETQRVLYERGAYNAYKFSHDGRYLALAIDRRVELWDTQTGQLSASFEPEGANLVQGPLHFTPDDSLLLLDTVVPAPAATRRSENDTSIIPWLWDVRAARREASTTLPNFSNAYPFFSFRNGLVIGPNRYLIAGIPARLQVIDGGNPDFPVLAEIESTRLERDPIYVWRSLTDDFLYVDPQFDGQIAQVNTRTGEVFDVPLERELDARGIEELQALAISNVARILGEPYSGRSNSFLRLLLGDGYGAYYDLQRTTVILLDILQPLTMGQEQMGLLIYVFEHEEQYGELELVRPQDVQQMVLHPDRVHLMVRRAYGAQQIEVYNLDTGILERTYYPVEPDGVGSHILAYNQTGDVILSDFERFDAETGEVLHHEQNYTSGFERYAFTEDSQNLVTMTGTDWRLWDIATGEILQRASLNLRGNVLRQSPDAFRFLTQFSGTDGEVIEIVDVAAGERRSLTIPYLPGRGIETIIPSDDWQNYLVVYSASPETQHAPGNEIAVYNFNRGQLLFIAGDDLPQPEGRQYGWLDDETIYVSSINVSSQSQPERVYSLEYHPSGLPACLVNAFPDKWQEWLPVWEVLTLHLRADELGHLAQRLCAALPASAGDVIPALTPTAPFPYRSDRTTGPAAIPGVPLCLTSRFQTEAINYAALWREMSLGLSEEQIQQLEVMLCEGLIGSVQQIAPTPTINPNMLNALTPTPIGSAPTTTERDSNQRSDVMMVNIETGQRFIGTYIPPHGAAPRDMALVTTLFETMQGFPPLNPVLSPDGALLAVADFDGFVTIYRLTKPYDVLVAEETIAQATRQAMEPPSIGLLPSPTPTFEYAGEARPTLTPTVTPTAPPLAATLLPQSQSAQIDTICPATTLYTLNAPPPDYAARGRLFVPPIDMPYVTWVLEPESGHLYPDDTLPRCGLGESCDFSFDQRWVVRQNEAIVISHPDGSQATTLFQPEERSVWPQGFRWLDNQTLQYTYQGYLPDQFDHAVTLLRQFNPVTGVRTDPFLPLDAVQVGGLPTHMLAAQPGGGSLELVSTPYNQGAKYYLYDRLTGAADYFARVDNGSLEYRWHPLGRYLYYRVPDNPQWYAFDVQTRQHGALGEQSPAWFGAWSPDGRYTANWVTLSEEETRSFLDAGQLLPKLSVWDSDSGLTRQYCLPETGTWNYQSMGVVWSPDSRYLAFSIQLPPTGDLFPTPTDTSLTPAPTATPLPLETIFQFQSLRTVALDVQTGSVTVLSTEVAAPLLWTDDGGGQ